VIAVDVSAGKLDEARRLGASHTLDGRDPNVTTAIMDLTGGRGVCAAFDFVGSDSTLDLALRTTRSLGKVSQIGLAGGTARLKPLESTRFEVLFETTLWGTIKELHEVVALAESGRLTSIAIETVPLERINDVVARLKQGAIQGRAVITPQKHG
jgi:propanol-preferring alcohol dehydrogenase